jgi:propionate CoA-transferase
VNHVSQVTFSGERALQRGQQVLFVTERAVSRLEADGVEPIEVALGVDIDRDVLQQMTITPIAKDVGIMSRSYDAP